MLRAPRPSEVPQRLWGAPEPEEHAATTVRRAALAREPLSMFAKAAAAERLEGFVIAGPQLNDAAGRAAWLGALVAALDPDGAPQAFQLAGVALRARAIGTADATLALVEPR